MSFRAFQSCFAIGPSDACWLWRGRVLTSGYGTFSNKLAHRLSYERANGPIPEGLIICHECDNPLCVNPSHLWSGTHADNVRDKILKRRHQAHGQTHCKRGHEFTTDNTYVRANGARTCRACNRAAVLRYKQRRRTA